MSALFQNVMQASIHGSVIIGVVLALRLVLRKTPKKFVCLLWLLAFARLLMPFEIESSFSLQPDVAQFSEAYIQEVQTEPAETPAMMPAVPDTAELPEDAEVTYGDAFSVPEAEPLPDTYQELYAESVSEEIHMVIDWNAVFVWVWGAVVCVFGLYSLISYLGLKRQVREAVKIPGGWECDRIETAFILGFLRPRIYIPMNLPKGVQEHILSHEHAHLDRGDHWMKLLGYIALAQHWFNPLVWVAYILLCKDIEMACDERVVQFMGLDQRKSYSAALLRCSTRKTHYAACPVAFGEVSVKARIRSVLNYRKPGFWISLVGILSVAFVAVFLMTSPGEEAADPSFLNYKNAAPLAEAQSSVSAVYYEDSTIYPCEAGGEALAEYLDSASWTERWWEPQDTSSPGSVEFIIAEGYRICIFDRNFARVKHDGEERYYRIGWGDYEKAKALVTESSMGTATDPETERSEEESKVLGKKEKEATIGSEEHIIPSNETSYDKDFALGSGEVFWHFFNESWAYYLGAQDATAGGLTLRHTHYGYPGDYGLYTGSEFWLEEFVDGKWVLVADPAEKTWDDAVHTIFENREYAYGEITYLEVDWKDIYGELEPGYYRIGRYYTCTGSSEREETQVCYAKFCLLDEKTERTVNQCETALENLLSADSYHLKTIWHVSGDLTQGEVWKSGEDYLSWEASEQKDGSMEVTGEMLRAGQIYDFSWDNNQVTGNVTNWESNVFDGNFDFWSSFFEINRARVLSVDVNGNVITVTEELNGEADYRSEWTFDADGGLRKLEYYTYSTGFPEGEIAWEVEILDTSADQIRSLIDSQDFSKPNVFTYDDSVKDKGNAQTSGFRNTTASAVRTPEDAIALADRECTLPVRYTDIAKPYYQTKVSYDPDAKMWKVELYWWQDNNCYQAIYMDDQGITQVIVTGNW